MTEQVTTTTAVSGEPPADTGAAAAAVGAGALAGAAAAEAQAASETAGAAGEAATDAAAVAAQARAEAETARLEAASNSELLRDLLLREHAKAAREDAAALPPAAAGAVGAPPGDRAPKSVEKKVTKKRSLRERWNGTAVT